MACLGSSHSVRASIIDLTTGTGSSGVINGALFLFNDSAGGTGVINPFVRIQSAQHEEGYNTSNPDLPFDAKGGTWTHDLHLNEIPIITNGGVDYFEFVLDINEAGGGGNTYLSLDEIQIYTSSVGSQNTTDLGSLGTLHYQMDAGEDSAIYMDYQLNAGSGNLDMTALIPVSFFAGATPDDFVYFYSALGFTGTIGHRKYGSTNGFEEWALQITASSVFIPSPGTLALLGISFLAATISRKRKRD